MPTETRHARADITRESVLKAIAECDELGRDAFLSKHGYRRSKSYVVEHEGREYDSKALLGVAFGYEYDCDPLTASEFSGGAEHCAKLMLRLGFTMRRKDETLTQAMVSAGKRLVRRVRRTVAALSAKVRALLVGLVSCTKDKLPEDGGPYKARDLYSPSWNFRRMVRYVEDVRGCDEWFVLSAKHGLLDPEAMVDYYDDTLAGAPKARRDEWAAEVREALQARYGGRKVKFVLMAGRAYSGAVEGLDAEVEEPLKGMGTGFRRRWLATNT